MTATETETISITQIRQGSVEVKDDTLVVEKDVSIELGGNVLLRTTCSPGHLYEWVIGYLFSEGLIRRIDDVKAVRKNRGVFSVELATLLPLPSSPPPPVESDLALSTERLLAAAREVTQRATIFDATGGTHAMAIIDRTGIVSFAEDISRTCALEKAIGDALLRDVALKDSFAFLSSRVPTRLLSKVGRCGIPILGAISAPTFDALQLADRLGICLCGFVRGDRLNVYSHGWRVGL